MRIRFMSLAAIAALSFTACHGKKSDTTTGGGDTAASGKSLYDRLGGTPAITAVVDDFVANVAADARINSYFANADIPHLKQMLVLQISEAGGCTTPECKYTGKDMKTAHKGMKIKDGDFDALVEDLKKSLDKFKVPAKEQGDLLGALGPMKPDIVGQ